MKIDEAVGVELIDAFVHRDRSVREWATESWRSSRRIRPAATADSRAYAPARSGRASNRAPNSFSFQSLVAGPRGAIRSRPGAALFCQRWARSEVCRPSEWESGGLAAA